MIRRTIWFCWLGVVACGGTSQQSPTDAGTSDAATGIELPPGYPSLTPASRDLGAAAIGYPSTPRTFTLSNLGNQILGPVVEVTPPFVISANGCTTLLAPGGSCAVSVQFLPTSLGAKTGTLTISGATAALSGTGVAARVDLEPAGIGFPTTALGSSSTDSVFTVSNATVAATGALSVTLAGPDAAQFGISPAGTCGPAGLAPGDSCTLLVHFTPTADEFKLATLVVTPAIGREASAALSGYGSGPGHLFVTPFVQDFGGLPVNTSGADATFAVANGHPSPVVSSLSGPDASQFVVVSAPCPGDGCSVVVHFSPTSPGDKLATLDVVAGSGLGAQHGSATLTGSGIVQSLTVAPTSTAFPGTAVGATSAATTLTITNGGAVTSGPLSTLFAGGAAPQFSLVAGQNNCRGAMLAAGATCTIAVAFSPTSPGGKSGALVVSGNPSGTATATLTGTAP